MQQVCLLCDRTSAGGDLFCQVIECPAEMSPTILNHGDWFGDIEIVKPVCILRSSVLYEAMHQKKKVFLKVAHPGPENKERLKREAEFLRSVQGRRHYGAALPKLLPPYANTTLAMDAYGRSMLQGHLLYFFLFDYTDSEPLRAVLLKNPQLWVNHVGWLMISLATTVGLLQHHERYHGGLSPECVLVHFDQQQNVPRILLYDLGLVSTAADFQHHWYPGFTLPAYTPPELVGSPKTRPDYRPNYQTDVYGLGLILYELLVGEPVYAYKLRSDTEILRAIHRSERVRMNRVEDVEEVAKVTLQAVQQQAASRQATARELAEQLIRSFGKPPAPRRSRWPSSEVLLMLISALLALIFLVLVVVWW
jgi:serine/threonine protein kinase